MPVIHSTINPRDAEFIKNNEAMQKIVADLKEKSAQIALGGEENIREKHTSRGKMLPRDRVYGLLDPGAPFPQQD
jgi:3-methylcrotonyl-CoA carboxylase beta subunit